MFMLNLVGQPWVFGIYRSGKQIRRGSSNICQHYGCGMYREVIFNMFFVLILCSNFLYEHQFVQILDLIIIPSGRDTLAKKYVSVITLNTRSQLADIHLPINTSTYILSDFSSTLSVEEIISRGDIYCISGVNTIKQK